MRTISSKQTVLACILALFAVVIGCDGADSKPESGATSPDEAAATPVETENTRTVIASSALPQNPQRIVSLAPNITEILFAIGAGNRVVGVTNYCDYPPVVKNLPKVGGFVNPDVEAILARKPDLVVGVTSAGNRELPDKLTEVEIPYVFLEVENVQQTKEAILFIGSVTGEIAPAAELVASIDKQLDAWSAELEDSPSVLVVYGYEPLVAAGPGSFAHELIEKAGATNALRGAKQAYGNLDAEKLLELDPDVIVDSAMAAEGQNPPWEAFPNLSAVKNNNVIEVSDPAVMRPGPRMVKGFKELSGAIQTAANRDSD